MMLLRKTITSFVLLGMVPLASLSLAACGGATSEQPAESNSNTSTSMAQMEHDSMSGSDHSGSMPMDHSAMDHGAMDMSLGPADETFDLRFIDAMILHHRGAIQMAEEAQQKSNRPEIQQLAADIIEAQNREENDLLRVWRQEWYPDAGAEPVMYDKASQAIVPMTEEYQQSMAMEVDLGQADEEFDLRFMNAMIPHHEGALVMAQEALEKSDRPEIQELAQNIIDSQQQEIDQMEQWRQEWYGQ